MRIFVIIGSEIGSSTFSYLIFIGLTALKISTQLTP